MFTKRRIDKLVWLAAVLLYAGCVPEETVRWNQAGTVGVYYADEKLGLINEQTGQTTIIEEREISPWPAISNDGSMLCYARKQEFTDFARARAALPAELKAVIDEKAAKTLKALEAKAALPEAVSSQVDDEMMRKWVQKAVYDSAKEKFHLDENADVETLELYELVLCSAVDPNEKQVLVTSFRPLGFCKFSPDGTHIGYTECGDELHVNRIFILSLKDRKPALVDDNTAAFFDWSPDSQAICYARAESSEAQENVIGTLCQRSVADAAGTLLVQTQDDGVAVISAERTELAGLMYGGWFINVQYGPGGRIFFSSPKLTLPASKLDDSQWSLFCCDTLTGAVADILPLQGNRLLANVVLFSLSPDGTKILMPNGPENTVVYDLNKREFTMIVGKEMVPDEDWPDFTPSWKGSDAVCCRYVKEDSGDEEKAAVGLFNLNGELIRELNIGAAQPSMNK